MNKYILIIVTTLMVNSFAVSAIAQNAGKKGRRIDMTTENIAIINKAINDAREKIGIFLSFDTRAPKLSGIYENYERRSNVYKSREWIVEIAQKEILAKAYFKEEGKLVSEFGKGDVEITLRFEFECKGEIIRKLNFYGFNFEKKIVWVELLP